MEPPA